MVRTSPAQMHISPEEYARADALEAQEFTAMLPGINAQIERQDFAVIIRPCRSNHDQMYAYSVGLALLNLPDVVLPAALHPEFIGNALGVICDCLLTSRLTAGVSIQMPNTVHQLILKPLRPHRDYPVHTITAIRPEIETTLLCAVLSDAQGRFPWDRGHAAKFWQAPLYPEPQ